MFVPAFVLSQPNFKVNKAHVLGQTFISQKFRKEQYSYSNVQVLSQSNFKVSKAHVLRQTFISQKFTKQQYSYSNVQVLSQPSFKTNKAHVLGQTFISQKFTKEQYSYSNVQGFFLKGACMYVLLGLSPFELILNQIQFLSLCT